jgi:hypothetical protein
LKLLEIVKRALDVLLSLILSGSMPVALDLLHRQIEFQSAVDHESNILKKLTYVPETRKVYAYLFEHTSDIQTLTAHHLGVDPARCVVSHWEQWIRGGFNVCIPVVVESEDGQPNRTVLMRCPMAYRLGEDVGGVDEKIGCEVATYAWMQDHCPDIKIPDLLGFGFPDGRVVSSAELLEFCQGLTLRVSSSLIHITVPFTYESCARCAAASAPCSAFPFHHDTSTIRARIH